MSADLRTSEPSNLDLIPLGATLGLGAGLIEAVLACVKPGRTSLLTGRGGDFVWMAPMVGVVLGLLSVLLLTAGRRIIPRVFTPKVILAVVSTIVLLSPLFLFQRLHRLSSLILAMGIGIQLASWLTRRPERIALGRRLLPLAAAGWAVSGLGLETAR